MPTTCTTTTNYPAWQKCGSFVINDTIQINPKTKSLLQDQERYVLYQNSWKKGRGRGANDACLGSGIRIKQPFSANRIGDLLQAFKNLLTSNYPAACLTPGGTVMSLG
ncbi:unnamed protein product [Porites lobata]|uniref:Uncharacterized protein n=1 Tax=Porites lobata TaxID=104759 RepID=A0ABN8QF80_9CNID|nr:unnamed protein product [Porites lobata]